MITRIVPETEECRGGSNSEPLKETAEMKSFTPFLSTSTDSSLHLKSGAIIKRNMFRGKASFPARDHDDQKNLEERVA